MVALIFLVGIAPEGVDFSGDVICLGQGGSSSPQLDGKRVATQSRKY
jgi:hypothetical protein